MKMINNFEKAIKDEVNELFDNLDMASLEKAKQMILTAEEVGGRVHITGIGKPSYVSGYCFTVVFNRYTCLFFGWNGSCPWFKRTGEGK